MTHRSVGSPYLAVACLVIATTTVVYVALLGQQGSLNGFNARIAFVLVVLLGSAILSGFGAFTGSAATRAIAAAACAGAMLPLGVLAAFSIGLPLVAAGSFALLAWRLALRDAPTPRATIQSLAAFTGAIAVLAIWVVASS